MITGDYLKIAADQVMWVSAKPDMVFSRGKGMILQDTDGNKYLDFVGGWAVTSLGHSPAVLSRAISRQSRRLVCPSPAYYNDRQLEFAALLTGLCGMDRVFFASTGAEANEGAVKIARKYGALRKNGAFEIITTRNGFHGRTLAMMAATGKDQWKNLYEPKAGGFIHVPYNDLEAVKAAVSEKTAAIMIELVQGEGGVVPADLEYVKALRRLCDEKQILLIFDEIQTGLGRSGRLFDFQNYGVKPDVLTLAKGIGGGFPLSALLADNRYCLFEPGDQGGTYTNQPLAMAAGLAVVGEIVRKDYSRRAALMGQYLTEQLKTLQQRGLIDNIRGRGLLQAFDLKKGSGAECVEKARKAGLLLNSPRPTTIRLMPALTVKKRDIDHLMRILENIL